MYTVLRLPGEEHRGLPGGVAATDHGHLGSLALLRLVGRRGVVDAAALEALASVDLEPAIVGASRHEQALGDDALAIVEPDFRVAAVERHARHGRADR